MRKLLTVLSVLVVLLGVVLVVADRVGVRYAQDEISKRVATQLTSRKLTTSAPPEVTITGVPFLTQAVAGNYKEIRVNLKDLKGGELPLTVLDVIAQDVRAPLSGVLDGTADVIATKVTGTGTVAYTSLVEKSGFTGITLSGEGGDSLRVSGQVPVVGTVTGTASVTVVKGAIRIQVTSLKATNSSASAVAQSLIDTYRSRLVITLKVPVLPFDMVVTGVEPTPEGLKVTVSAQEVKLS
jgi:hypothetical protein